MILLLMINIILSMILCMFINYHIYCGFPASQIRFLAVPDLPVVIRPRPTLHHNMQWLSKLQELPDVVFLPCPVTRPPAAENCGMIILWA